MTAATPVIRVGDTVFVRTNFGQGIRVKARIKRMEVCERPRMKHGTEVPFVERWRKNFLVVDLDNNSWAYGDQLDIPEPAAALQVGANWQTQARGTNDQEYQIYLANADDGKGGDITRNGQPLLSYEEWLTR